jgi:hypothetical protein
MVTSVKRAIDAGIAVVNFDVALDKQALKKAKLPEDFLFVGFAIFLSVLASIGLGDFARQMVTGFIIVAAVVIDTYRAQLLTKFQ